MSKPTLQADNRFSRQTLMIWAIVLVGWLVSLGLYFSQPSILGLTDDQRQPLGRFVDLTQMLLFDQVAAGMVAHGRMESSLLDRWPLLLGLCAWLGSAGWVGWPLIVRSSLFARAGRLELVMLSVFVGGALLSTATLTVGMAGGLGSRWPLLSVWIVLLLAAGLLKVWPTANGLVLSGGESADFKSLDIKSNRSIAVAPEPDSWAGIWLWRLMMVGTWLIGTLTLLGCMMPPWEFDVVEYHLQAPKEFSQLGSIGFVSHNIYANMPLGAEMHSLAAMTILGGGQGWWWGGLIGKTITGSFSLLSALLLGAFLARKLGRWSGWCAAGLLLATPGNAHVAMAGLIDMVLAGYLLAATVATTLLWQPIRSGTARWSDGLLIGLLAGGAAACKYTGLLFVVFPIAAAVLVALVYARRRSEAIQVVCAGGLGLALTCLPWYLKNFWWTGNPFFPLAAGIFGSGGLSAEQLAQWRQAHRVPVTVEGSVYGPSAMWDGLEQVLLRSNFLPPTLVFLALCGVVLWWLKPPGMSHKWQRGWIFLIAWVGLVWWLGTHRIDRFWLPALPLACGIASLGATWIARQLSFRLASTMVLVSLLYGGFLVASGAIGDNRFLVSLTALRGDSGSDVLPGRLTTAIGWANATLDPTHSRLLLIGEAKAYDFRMPVVYSTCFDRSPAEAWLRGQTPEQQRDNLKGAGITHLLVNWNELARYRSPGNYGFSDWPEREDIARLVADQVLRPLDSELNAQQVAVFEVIDPLAK